MWARLICFRQIWSQFQYFLLLNPCGPQKGGNLYALLKRSKKLIVVQKKKI